MSVSVYIQSVCFGDLSATGDTISVCRVCVCGSCGGGGVDIMNVGSGSDHRSSSLILPFQ